MNRVSSKTPSKRKDRRPFALFLMLALVLLIGVVVQQLPSRQHDTQTATPEAPQRHQYEPFETRDVADSATLTEERGLKAAPTPIDPDLDPNGHAQQRTLQETQVRFHQASVMLEMGRFEEALVALERAKNLTPDSPDIWANIGFALLGMNNPEAAYAAFDEATSLNPAQANAYYGAAIALESLGNLEGALGGMRSFLHLTDMGPNRIHVARARSAIWEWESKLGRGAWGPTKGIPPGFTADELKRDGGGVGIKMQLPDTMDESGNMKYEIKHQDKFQLFDP